MGIGNQDEGSRQVYGQWSPVRGTSHTSSASVGEGRGVMGRGVKNVNVRGRCDLNPRKRLPPWKQHLITDG